MTEIPPPRPIRAVLFDLHATLLDQGSSQEWLDRALALLPDADTAVPAADRPSLVAFLHHVWENARDHDPDSLRDLSSEAHREVFHSLLEQGPDVDAHVADALYDTLLDTWHAYDDAVPVLDALREAGIATAVLSNVGIDVRHVLEREGVADRVDAVILSCEVGAVKPDGPIFAAALAAIGAQAEDTLMVGDSGKDDAGAAHLGIRTLLLPRTPGPVHGLSAVLRLVGV